MTNAPQKFQLPIYRPLLASILGALLTSILGALLLSCAGTPKPTLVPDLAPDLAPPIEDQDSTKKSKKTTLAEPVTIVSPKPSPCGSGCLTGTISLPDQSRPSSLHVFAWPVDSTGVAGLSDSPTFDGTDTLDFRIVNLKPGRYGLSFSGPEFAPHQVEEVVIQSGQETAVGVIDVSLGRHVTGIVRNKAGLPVKAAKVFASETLYAHGGILAEGLEGKSVVTDQDGAFLLRGLSNVPVAIVAEAGQSRSSVHLHSANGPQDLRLVLKPVSSVQGKITYDGQQTNATVELNQEGVWKRAQFFIHTGPDGAYRFQGIAPGRYRLIARRIKGNQHAVWLPASAQMINVGESGIVVDQDIPKGKMLRIRPGVHRKADSLTCYLGKGKLVGRSLEELDDEFSRRGDEEVRWNGVSLSDGGHVIFEDVMPGPYTLCSLIDQDEPKQTQTVCQQIVVNARRDMTVTVQRQ